MVNLEKAVDNVMKISVNSKEEAQLLGKQYEKLMDYITKSNDQRTSLNAFYNTVSAALITAIVSIYNLKLTEHNKHFLIIGICLAGLMLTYTWANELKRFYKSSQVIDLVVAKIESKLPSNPFEARQKLLSMIGAPEKTEKQEIMIPTALSLIYLICSLLMAYLSIK